MRRRGLPLGHELRGSLPVLGPRAEKPLAAPGGGLHAAGFQAARNHAPDGGEALHLHRQLHHASAAPGNRSPYLKEPSSPSPALISRTLLLGTIPAPGAPPPLVFFFPLFLHLPPCSPTNLLTPLPGWIWVWSPSHRGRASLPAVQGSIVTSAVTSTLQRTSPEPKVLAGSTELPR